MASEVTIVIPAFNAKATIARAIESALIQEGCLVLVIDDASTDGTFDEARTFSSGRLNCVRLSRNKGIGFVRRYALSLVKTPYVAWLDADDVFLKNRISGMLSHLKNEALDIVFDHSELYCGRTDKYLKTMHVPDFLLKDASFYRLFERNYLPGPNWFLSSLSFLKKISYDDTFRHAEDYDFILRALMFGAKIGCVDSVGYRQYALDGSLSRGLGDQKKMTGKALLKHGYESILSLYSVSEFNKNNVFLAMSRVALYREDYVNALFFIDKVNECSFDFLFYRGTTLLLLERYAESVGLLKSACEINSKPDCLNNLGVAFREKGKEVEALKCFSDALVLFPEYLDAKINLRCAESLRITTHELRTHASRSVYSTTVLG